MPDDELDPLYRQINDAIVRSSTSSLPPVPRRRRLPRESTSWSGRYRLDKDDEWRDCEVVDVWIAGVGAVIAAPTASELVGQPVTMEVYAAAGSSFRLELSGVVRHVVPTPDGRIRVGVEFAELSETERTILDALERMGLGW